MPPGRRDEQDEQDDQEDQPEVIAGQGARCAGAGHRLRDSDEPPKPITDQLVTSGHAMHAATLVVNSPELPTASLVCRVSVNTPKAPCVLGIVSRPDPR
jgi:hypothetical protein